MEMMYGLPGIVTRVRQQSEAARRHSVLLRNFDGKVDKTRRDDRVGPCNLGDVTIVPFRYDQDVRRRLGMQIAERDALRALCDKLGAHFPTNDPAKNAIVGNR